MWELLTGKEVKRFPDGMCVSPVKAIATDVAGDSVAVATQDGLITVWNMALGNEPQLLKMPADKADIRWIAPSLEKQWMVATPCQEGLSFWEPSNKSHLGTVNAVVGGRYWPFRNFPMSIGNKNRLMAMGYSNGQVGIWEIGTGKQLPGIKIRANELIRPLAISPVGKLLATACATEPSLQLWNTATGKELRSFDCQDGFICTMAFSADDKLLATASDDHRIKLWDVSTGKELQWLKGHSGPVTAIAFTKDCSMVATGSEDYTAAYMGRGERHADQYFSWSLGADFCFGFLQ